MLLHGMLYRCVTILVTVLVLGTSSVPPAVQSMPEIGSPPKSAQPSRTFEPEAELTAEVGVRAPTAAARTGPASTLAAIDPGGEPAGFALDAGMQGLDGYAFAPPTLAYPLSISRVQSAYTAVDAVGHTVVVTFTVTNNRPPAFVPNLPLSPTITDTLQTLSNLDLAQDANAIHGVLLADNLLPANASFVSASPVPDRSGDSLAWNLGTIPPLSSVTATLRIQIPASVADFTDLDSGATAWGSLQGRAVSATAAPATLAPDNLASWLVWTVDADHHDEYLAQKAAELGNDWSEMFTYVRSLSYESYTGSLRGARGTLWSEAGNSLDQASLLIAMLRASGIPARYRHGTLSTARAQELILSMFPEPGGTVGYMPPSAQPVGPNPDPLESLVGIETADPANDAQLLAETTDHWWVEAYLPGTSEWTDLDPSFADAMPDETFYDSLAGDGTDQIAEVPDGQRHKVTMRLKVEYYHVLTPLESGLGYSFPLVHTFNTVELVGRPIALAHLVTTDVAGGVFYRVGYSYVPFLVVGDYEAIVEGDPYQELYSSFPLGTMPVTGQWLLFDVRDPEGNVETYTRQLLDRLGFEIRLVGGQASPDLSGPPPGPLAQPSDVYVTYFSMSATDFQALDRGTTGLLAQAQLLAAMQQTLQAEGSLTDEQSWGLAREFRNYTQQQLGLATMLYDLRSSAFGRINQQQLLVKAYPTAPRIFIASADTTPDTVLYHSDLLKNDTRALAYPGQNIRVEAAYQTMQGNAESVLEGQILAQVTGLPALTSMDVYNQAILDGIPMVLIFDGNLDQLAALPISSEAKARIHDAVLNHDKVVCVPAQMVTLAGTTTLAWLEVDATGNTIAVQENGLHSALTEYIGKLTGDYSDESASQAFLGGVVVGATISYLSLFAAVQVARVRPEGMSDQDWKLMKLDTMLGTFVGMMAHAYTSILTWFPGDTFMRRFATKLQEIISGHILDQGKAIIIAALTNGDFDPSEAIEALRENIVKELANFITEEFGTWLLLRKLEGNAYNKMKDRLEAFSFGVAAGSFSTSIIASGSIVGLALADPQLPPTYYSLPPARKSPAPSAQAQVSAGANVASGPLQATLQTAYAATDGPARLDWADARGHTWPLAGLTTAQARVYDGGGLLGQGAVVADALSLAATAGIAAGPPVTYAVQGNGQAAFHAPALQDLGLGSNWTYTVTLSAPQTYTLSLQNAELTLEGSIYRGDFTLTLTTPATLNGAGPAAVPNFAPATGAQIAAGDLDFGSAALLAGSLPFDPARGFALTGFTGALTVSQQSTALDQIVLSGDYAQSLSLALSPAASSIPPVGSTAFATTLYSNLADTYTLTVEGPPGWDVALDAGGAVTVGPPLDAEPGLYTILVTAQSVSRPALVASAVHTVTLIAHDELRMDVAPDPRFVLPWGPHPYPQPGFRGGLLDLPEAAYTVNITNASTVSHTFAISVTPTFPADWLLLSGDQVGLSAGRVAQVGLYVSPTLSTLPPPGTIYPFTVDVTASDAPALSAQDVDAFTMPAVPYHRIGHDPLQLYATPGVTVTFDLGVHSVGNVSGSFGLSVTLPISTWQVSNLVTPLALNPDQAYTQAVTVHVASGEIGRSYHLEIQSTSDDVHTRTTWINLDLVGPIAFDAYQTAQIVGLGFPDQYTLQVALEYLAETVDELQQACAGTTLLPPPGTGPCSTALRDDVAAAAQIVADQVPSISPLVTGGQDLEQTAQALQIHTAWADISDDLDDLQTAIVALQVQLERIAQRNFVATFTPGAAATLLNQPLTYTLSLENAGSLTTTYALTLTGLPAGWPNWTNQSANLAPGASTQWQLVVTPTTATFRTFSAQIRAVEDALVQAEAHAGLSAADAYLKVLALSANPSFVETGSSSTDLAVSVANVVNLYQPAVAHTQVLSPDGSTVWSADVALGVETGPAQSYALGSVDTSGWTAGVYTLSVELLDGSSVLIPDGSGTGYLGVGQALTASQAVVPDLVPSGTVTVTTYVTTQLRAGSGGAQRAAPALRPAAPAVTGLFPPSTEELGEGQDAALPGSAVLPARAGEGGTIQAGGIERLEEDNAGITYNGSWSASAAGWASGGQGRCSLTANNTAVITFTGTWVGVGFLGATNRGYARVTIDGLDQDEIDTYTHDNDTLSHYYGGLVDSTHTLTVTVVGTKNAFSGNTFVCLDYFDTWDGTAMGDGTFEQEDARVYRSNNWVQVGDPAASGDSYMRAINIANAWFPFTGDSVTYQAVAYDDGGYARVLLDGVYQDTFDLYNATSVTRTFSFSSTPGAHVLQVQFYRFAVSVDAFTTPGSPPFYQPEARSGVIRYEEDDTTLRYNGAPFRQTKTSWTMINAPRASGGWFAESQTLSDTVSLTFTGTWAGVGFLTNFNCGEARVFIDGVQQGSDIDTYDSTPGVLSRYYAGLADSSHTLSVVVPREKNPASSSYWVFVDFIDAWDGTAMPQGRFEAVARPGKNRRIPLSTGWTPTDSPWAGDGSFVEGGTNAWFLFTGDAVQYLPFSGQAPASDQVYLDGVYLGTADRVYDFSPSPLAIQYTAPFTGAHVLHIANLTTPRLDAFETPPTAFAGIPMVEWYDGSVVGDLGVQSTTAVGDLDGDGNVEIAVASDSDYLYLYRGDGSDAGGGSPLIWDTFIGSEPIAPALAELDGSPGAEIVVDSVDGLYAFHDDGSLYWFTDTIRANWFLGGAAIANMDADPAPEIVVAGIDAADFARLCLFEADGSLSWLYPFGDKNAASSPLLADLTGDGALDILLTQGNQAYLFDYALGTTAWTHTFSSTVNGWQTAAIADVDGQQPGGDPGPEIAVTWNGYVELLDADGSRLWLYYTGGDWPGPTSIADTDGDGEVEIVATARADNGPGYKMGHIYVLNADGSLLWDALAQDETSGTGASVHDLDGDGVWEIVWNGYDQGLTIYRGSDGAVLFNEPLIDSHTAADYPIVVDVDGDGHGEIVTADEVGLYVVGYDVAWGSARPLWNQYNYHITNIADDLSVPPTEPDSWVVHNTYRTQSREQYPAPAYGVDLTHTVALSDVEILTSTFSVVPDSPAPAYHWAYDQYWYEATHAISFDSRLPDVTAGQVRQVSQGSEIAYHLRSGSNRLTLPPLYVESPHLLALAPPTRTVHVAGTTAYTASLYNPTTAGATYTVSLSGLPAGFSTPQVVRAVPAGGTVTATLTLSVPAAAGNYPLAAQLQTEGGGRDAALAVLVVTDNLDLLLWPPGLPAGYGQTVTYTLALTNEAGTARTFDLAVAGLDAAEVSLAADVTLAAGEGLTLPLAVTPRRGRGLYPFSVRAAVSTAGGVLHAQAGALLAVTSELGVTGALCPASATGGQASPAAFSLGVTNTGTLSDTYDVALSLPGGWIYALSANGQPVDHLSLAPFSFHGTNLHFLVTPADGTAIGDYVFTTTLTSRTDPAVMAAVSGTVHVSPYGVTVSIDPGSSTIDPTGSQTWDVTVTNTGEAVDTFDLRAGGIVSGTASFSPNPVVLAAGASTVVQLAAGPMPFALAQTYPFAVTAHSRGDPAVLGYDLAEVTFSDFEDVQVAIWPASQTVTDTLDLSYLVVVTNSGNVGRIYDLNASAEPILDQDLRADRVYIPAHMSAVVPLAAKATASAEYTLTIQASSTGKAAADSATAKAYVLALPMQLEKQLAAGVSDTAQPGDLITYTLVVTNVGSIPVAAFTLTDVLPAQVTYTVGSGWPPPTQVTAGELVWTGLDVAAGSALTCHFVVTVSQPLTDPLKNVAWLWQLGQTPISSTVLGPEGPSEPLLAYFTASPLDQAILLQWETTTEVDTQGFNLYRATSAGGPLTQLNGTLIPAQTSGSPVGSAYDFVDDVVEPGVTYWYWLDDVNLQGLATRHGPVTAVVVPGDEEYRIYLPLVWR